MEELTKEQLIETNKRLNRRCQKLEHDMLTLQNDLSLNTTIKKLQIETRRAWQYSNHLRDIYLSHRYSVRDCYRTCWWCWFRTYVRFKAWQYFFSIKKNK